MKSSHCFTLTRKPLGQGFAMAILLGFLPACTPNTGATQAISVDFRTFKPVGDAVWTQTETRVSTRGNTPGFLISDRKYRDFQLSVEFRIDGHTNSGIFVRCQDPQDISPDTCYEMNIWDNHPRQEFRTGSVVKLSPAKAHVTTLNYWNNYRIIAQGDRLEVFVNGIQTTKTQHSRLADGFVALQFAEQGFVEFKNLIIRSL